MNPAVVMISPLLRHIGNAQNVEHWYVEPVRLVCAVHHHRVGMWFGKLDICPWSNKKMGDVAASISLIAHEILLGIL